MRLLPALLLATSIAGPLAGPALAADPPALTPAQRADVVTILRDTLRTNPSILRDALAALQADDDRRQDTAQTDVLQLLAGKLVDPAKNVEIVPMKP